MANSDARADALLASMGEAIRLRRRSLGLTLKDVQVATGLSHPFLSKVERGLVRPSMRSLTSVADVLGTTAHALMTLDASEEVGDVRSGSSLEVAHGDGIARALVRGSWPFLPVEYCAGPREFEEFYIHPGREMMYVAVGVCEVEIDGHGVYELGPGESLFYGAQVKHRWRKLSRGAIRILLIQENADTAVHELRHIAPRRGRHVANGRGRGQRAERAPTS
jgi:transcriptional regulator with XRE-family HTH domain